MTNDCEHGATSGGVYMYAEYAKKQGFAPSAPTHSKAHPRLALYCPHCRIAVRPLPSSAMVGSEDILLCGVCYAPLWRENTGCEPGVGRITCEVVYDV